MSVEPPSSGRPAGPPSGPLSGPPEPPPGPPSQPPGGGAEPPEPRPPWWRSAPRIAVLAAVVVAAVVVAVVLTRPDGGGTGSQGEVFLQPAGSTGPDPFTESTATDSSAPPATPSPATGSPPPNAVRGVAGGAPGLYGGTRNVATCDVEKQIRFLQADEAKNRAFASVAGVAPSQVPAHLRSLTPVQLRMDTRVTNHGYRAGAATSYQAVLQAGTAVLVDDRGVPRVRCACGNPLTPPVAQRTTPKPTGEAWPSYRSSNVVVVTPAPKAVDVFVLYDPDRGEWIARRPGDTGGKDQKTEPPATRPTPSLTPSTPPSPAPDSPPSPSPRPRTSAPEPPAPEPESPQSPRSPEPPESPEPLEPPESPEAPESPAPSPPQPPLASGPTARSSFTDRVPEAPAPAPAV
ncbi:DUF6777 domain-containing protein [Streptomyces sp. NPDC059862]|uniref:DUF6777 domain-containing protein n=1 Tax=Streptomyces sp. NPDC059862 TaxID=3346975 RepID=UPI0036494D02